MCGSIRDPNCKIICLGCKKCAIECHLDSTDKYCIICRTCSICKITYLYSSNMAHSGLCIVCKRNIDEIEAKRIKQIELDKQRAKEALWNNLSLANRLNYYLLPQLREIAKSLAIKNTSGMSKSVLIKKVCEIDPGRHVEMSHKFK